MHGHEIRKYKVDKQALINIRRP